MNRPRERTFTAYVQKVGAWYVATCEEVAEASARGRTPAGSLANLKIALGLALRERRDAPAAGSKTPPIVVRRAGRVDRLA